MSTNTQKGNVVVWILVIVVIAIGVYFIVKNGNGTAVQPYSNTSYTNTPSNTTAQNSDDLSADFNSASNDLDATTMDNVDAGL